MLYYIMASPPEIQWRGGVQRNQFNQLDQIELDMLKLDECGFEDSNFWKSTLY